MLRRHVRKGGSVISLLLTMLLVVGTVLCGVAVSRVTSVQAAPSATPNVSMASGYYHSLLVNTDGTLWAWGRNDKYQLGLNNTDTKPSPTKVGSATNWKSVAAGWYHSVGVRSDGTLYAWGYNERGQLGLGDNTTRYTPTKVGSATNWKAVSTGQYHSLGLRTDGTLWAWGYNFDGQLGLGDNVTRNSPTRVGNWTDWVAVAAGDSHSLGVRSNGRLYGWGYNSNGQTGNGGGYKTPTQVGTETDWVAVAAEFHYSMGIRSDGTLWGWGFNGQNQLGLGDGVEYYRKDQSVPQQVGTDTGWAGVAPGRVHCLGVRSDGTLWAWGANYEGELGMGENDTDERSSPDWVRSATNWVTASDGDAWSVGVRSDGTLWGWGRNGVGQLGLGTTGGTHLVPEKCPTLTMDWPPSVDTLAATGIWANAATLNCSLANLGSASPVQVSFEYGLTTSYGYATAPQALYSTGAFSTAIGNLEPQTTYHYRAKADGDGDDYGEDMTFTTNTVVAIPPTVATGTASGVGSTSATLSGTLTSMGTALSVQVSFEHGLTTGYGHTTTPQTLSSPGTFSFTLTGLAPGTVYHYRAEAVGDGAVYGGDSTFTTGTDPPVVTTGAATSLGTTSATLGGALTSMGTASSVQVCFEYGPTTSYGNTTTPQALTSTSAFSFTLNGLAPATTYHYRAKATGNGSSYGMDTSFTTNTIQTVPPVVATGGSSSVTASSARLNGHLNSLGTAKTATVSFLWGTSPGSYSEETAGQTMGSSGPFYFDLSGLSPGRTYYYQSRAVGDGDPAFGVEKSFTTVQGPKVDSVDPGSGKPGQHLAVTIWGSGLDGATNISFGSDIVVKDFTVNSTNEITAEIAIDADAAKGARDISVTTDGGTANKADGFRLVGGGGGVCGGAGLATPGKPSEMASALAAILLSLGAGYWYVRKRARRMQGNAPGHGG